MSQTSEPLLPSPSVRPRAFLQQPVRSIMRAGVVSVPDDASVRSVQRALVGHRLHAVLVVDACTAQPIGWATATGVLEHLLGADASLMPAAVAVTDAAESISPSATAEEALRLMLATGCARLLVRRHPGAPAEGVVSEMDVVRLGTSG
jgi:CBS domain-containing protein